VSDAVTVTIYAKRDALMPTRGSKHCTGLDLRASEAAIIRPGRPRRVPTGISIHVNAPPGVAQIDIQTRGRSGMASLGYLLHVGTIDLDFRGQLDAILYNFTREDLHIRPGDRIAQLVVPEFAIDGSGHFEVVPVLLQFAIGEAPVDTERGADGYGSTGQ